MYRVVAKQALAGRQLAVVRRDYRFRCVFAGEPSTSGVTTRVKNESADFICSKSQTRDKESIGSSIERIPPAYSWAPGA